MRAYERLLHYVTYDTASDPNCEAHPSSARQLVLSQELARELTELGLADVSVTDAGYVLATLPATAGWENKPVVGLIAHIDTSPDLSGKDVKARIVAPYDGGDVELGHGYVLSSREFPDLKKYEGQSLIVTDGTTLLGADDKAGVAEIMTALEQLLTTGAPHGTLKIAFTTDEEVGRGVDCFDVKAFGADYAYTVDGGDLDYYAIETFNAAAADIRITGRNIHPGSAKGKMINAARIACEFDSLLPAAERPEFTEGREGFFHLQNVEANEEAAHMQYIIRDHDRARFEHRKQQLQTVADLLADKYGRSVVQCRINDSYYNMYEVLKNYPDIEKKIVRAMKAAGIDAPKAEPVRGGTDGARLSFMGLPCPNLPTGGYNFHGRYEYISAEAMDTAVQLLLELVKPENV